MAYIKQSLLEDFELPEVSIDTIKSGLAKINKVVSVKKSNNFESMSLLDKLSYITNEVYKVLGRYKGFVKVIYDIDTLEKYIDKAIAVDYLAFDTETNNSLDPLTCKLMGLCLYIPNTKPVYVPVNHCKPGTEERLENQVTEEQAKNILMRLKDTKLVYHNGKFDIRVINNTLGFYLPIWWDTMLAAQLINEEDLAKLKYQFKKYVDPTIGTYNIEKLFTGLPYAWVDPEVFALYAAIDAYDTYKLQQYQEKLFNLPDMHNLRKLFLEVEVPVTLIVAKMEDHGIAMDLEFVNKLNKKYHKGLDKSIKKLDELLLPYKDTIEYYQKLGQLENPLNFNSTPQLLLLLYDILKIPVVEEFGKTTSKDALKAMNHPFTKALLDYRHYTKMITAFTEALPKLASVKDGRIHANFNQMGMEENNVRTGRFSCIEENQLVRYKDKSVPIKDVSVGDIVCCYNESGYLKYSKVLNKFDKGKQICNKYIFKHCISGDEISLICTPDHKLFTQHGWKQADDLIEDDALDCLYLSNLGETGFIYSMNFYKKECVGRKHVYDLEVEEYHNFIVNNICVHNCTNPNLQQIPSKEKVMRLMFKATEINKDIEVDNNKIICEKYSEIYTPNDWQFVDKLNIGDNIYISENNLEKNCNIKNIEITDKNVILYI